MTTPTETPDQARQTLATLTARGRDLSDHLADLTERCERLAYAALTNSESRKRLDQLTKEAVAVQMEIRHVENALSEARRRIQAADEQARLDELRRRATAALAMLDDLDQQGELLSQSMVQFADAFRRFEEIGSEIAKLGMGFPNPALVRVNASRAIDSALWTLRLSNRPVPPADRRTFADLLSGWRTQVSARAATVLGDDSDEEAA